MASGPPKAAKPAPSAKSGRLLVVAAAIMWSTSGFFAKAPLFEEWPQSSRGPLLAFWRAAMASLVLLPLVRRPRWTPRLIPMVLTFAAMNVTYLSALVLTSAANAIWLQNTAPAWVFLIGVLFLGEPVHRRDWLVLVFGIIGVAVILAYEIRGESLLGVILGLLSGFFYGGVVLTIRHLRDHESAWLVALNHLSCALLFLPFVLWRGIWPSGEQLVMLAGFGMVQMGIPYLMFATGVRSVTGHEASGIALLEPVLVPIWVYVAWRHAPTYQGADWWTLVGGALILTGLTLRYLGARGAKSEI